MVAKATMADIAKQLGISRAAVSYALNGQPGVAADTRERVLKLAVDLGWHPSASARALTGSDIKVIGLALSRATDAFAVDSFFLEFMAGVESVLVQRGWSLLLRVIGDVPAVEVETYRRWWGRGALTASSSSTNVIGMSASRRSKRSGCLPCCAVDRARASRSRAYGPIRPETRR
ncbi:LacI family DNA-binding transcriptional regulator [Flexivirga alba]|uniref:LacI family DNA-binding transcriptional regulator n=1 Tax=Flexivirga alba TaxID=702742 RepID=A0ABW2AG31_9MICO